MSLGGGGGSKMTTPTLKCHHCGRTHADLDEEAKILPLKGHTGGD